MAIFNVINRWNKIRVISLDLQISLHVISIDHSSVTIKQWAHGHDYAITPSFSNKTYITFYIYMIVKPALVTTCV